MCNSKVAPGKLGPTLRVKHLSLCYSCFHFSYFMLLNIIYLISTRINVDVTLRVKHINLCALCSFQLLFVIIIIALESKV